MSEVKLPALILRNWLCQSCQNAIAEDYEVPVDNNMSFFGLDAVLRSKDLRSEVICTRCADIKEAINSIGVVKEDSK